jgi:hypothetical protein
VNKLFVTLFAKGVLVSSQAFVFVNLDGRVYSVILVFAVNVYMAFA